MAVASPVRVMLADDQAKVRSALRLMIDQEQYFHVVGEAREADELLLGMLRNCPQVILLDWELPGLPDSHKLDLLKRIEPHVKVIALSGQPEARKPALADGADFFISKSDPPEGVLKALYSVHAA